MFYDVHYWIETGWGLVAIFWALTAFRLKPVVRAQRTGSRLLQVSLLVSAAVLLFSAWPHAALLDSRVLRDSALTAVVGITLTVAGVVVAIAARVYLGRNWSGRATIKEGHELVRNGPYALVRHPIYTGLLIAAIGTAIAFGQVRNLAALPLLLLGFGLKLREEERLLFQAFGAQYSAYQQAVRSAIIPFIL